MTLSCKLKYEQYSVIKTYNGMNIVYKTFMPQMHLVKTAVNLMTL